MSNHRPEKPRVFGTVETMHQHPQAGSYGVIRGDDGKPYVWAAGNVFRNFSRLAVGIRVMFAVIDYSYATEISSRFEGQDAG